MIEKRVHEHCVDAWLTANGGRDEDVESGHVVELLLTGLSALWGRAQPSLGEVTLAAIFQRAIHTAERRHEALAQLALYVSETGAIAITNPTLPRIPLADAAVCVLVEVLRVVGSVTADTLTPALHAALSSTATDETSQVRSFRGPGSTQPRQERVG
jgi:hypothetical protein